jgi:predicted ATPase
VLILDNFEHLLAADGGDQDGARLVSRIAEAAPGLKVLVTSRVVLGVQREEQYPVGGLAYPAWAPGSQPEGAPEEGPAFSAVRLFVQGARRVDPGFELGPANLDGVIRVCNLVAGMPLGILLASAWVRMMTPGQIAGQLETGLDLLETSLRDVVPRQRSMRAVCEHSWRLLTDRERGLMQALSVFRGGFTRQAARAVVGASLRDLRSLVDRSLVQPAEGGRFEIHELMRQFAAERLAQSPGEVKAVRGRHAAYFALALERWGADLKGPRQLDALREADADIDNARTAWDWAAAQADVDLVSQAIEGLGLYYQLYGTRLREGESALRRAMARLEEAQSLAPGASPTAITTAARMLAYEALFSRELGCHEDARGLVRQGLELLQRSELAGCEARSVEALLWHMLYGIERLTGRGKPRESLERCLALARSAGDRWRTRNALMSMADADMWAGRHIEARQALDECIAIGRELGDQRGIAASMAALVWVDVQEGQVEAGERLARKALPMLRRYGLPRNVAFGLQVLAAALSWGGKYAEAVSALAERRSIYADLGLSLPIDLSMLGQFEHHQGQYERARAHLHAAFEETRDKGPVVVRAFCQLEMGRLAVWDGDNAEARRVLLESIGGLEACQHLHAAAQAQAVSVYAALGLGNREAARYHLVLALRWARDRQSHLALVEALPAAALLHLGQDEVQATEIYELARTLPAVANSQWFDDVAGRRVTEAATRLPPGVVAAAKERGRARDMQSTLDELIAEWGDRS